MSPLFRLAGAWSLAVLLGACAKGDGTSAAGNQPTVLRTYAVPAAQTEAIGRALNEVFAVGPEGHRIGRASHELPGQLMVLAPESVQASIAESIASIAGDGNGPSALRTVSLRLWLVDGRPGPGEAADRLAVLAPAIKAMSGNFPDYGFHIIDQAELAVTDGGHDSVLVTGAGNEFSAQLRGADPMTFSVSVRGTGTETSEGLLLRSMLNLPSGELVVMARLQAQANTAADGPAAMRFLILQAVDPAH